MTGNLLSYCNDWRTREDSNLWPLPSEGCVPGFVRAAFPFFTAFRSRSKRPDTAETGTVPETKGYMMDDRPYKIDGYPVSKQEVLDQATMIRGNEVRSIGLAMRIIREEGRDVGVSR